MTIKNFKRDDLSAMRATITAHEEEKAAYANGTGPKKVFGDGANFPFWNQPSKSLSVIRFLPDGDIDNPVFWKEFLTIKIPFEGIVGQTGERVEVTVPCMKTWKENCPVVAATKGWWGTDKEELARQYYFKRKFIYQGIVSRTELEEENVPENPIRRFTFGPQIHKIVYNYVNDPDLRYSPTDPENGRDFRISRVQSGTAFPDYSGSSWAMNDRALTDAEINAIEQFGLFELKDFIPKKPTAEEVQIISEMFQASINGEEYDPARFAQYYRPAGLKYDASSNNTSEQTSSVEKEIDDEPKTSLKAKSPQDAIAAIKAARANKA